LTISQHRKRNLELRIQKIEDEEQRKIAAVHDAIKCLTNSFSMQTLFQINHQNDDDFMTEKKENNEILNEIKITKKKKSLIKPAKSKSKSKSKSVKKNKNKHIDKIFDDDDDETIIEIIDDDFEEDTDYMIDHNTFNNRQKKQKQKTNVK